MMRKKPLTPPFLPSLLAQEALGMWGKQLGEDQKKKKIKDTCLWLCEVLFLFSSSRRHSILRELLPGVEYRSCSSLVRFIILGASLIANMCYWNNIWYWNGTARRWEGSFPRFSKQLIKNLSQRTNQLIAQLMAQSYTGLLGTGNLRSRMMMGVSLCLHNWHWPLSASPSADHWQRWSKCLLSLANHSSFQDC